jgi:very-short-patch-repair endonuclease
MNNLAQRRTIIPYNPVLKERARHLRNHSTLTEVILWLNLKGRQMRGYDFHRQKPLYHFIVDFFCNELMLAIEIDGGSHDGKDLKDKDRQDFLESKGIHFLRFSVEEVTSEGDRVLERIGKWIDQQTGKDTPLPLSRGDNSLLRSEYKNEK